MKRSHIITLGTVVALLAIVVAVLSYYGSTTAYIINYSHLSKIEVIQISQDNTTKSVAQLARSGQTIRLSNDASYQLNYSGAEGYADDTYTITKDITTVTIDPDYSDETYAGLIAKALPAVREAISERYPRAEELFSIDQGAMRDKATWFTARLAYKGEYSLNSDNLRVVLKQEKDSWKLVTEPDIIVTSTNYPRVPIEVLSWANGLFLD
jgi:hypothetical protein